MPTRPTLGHPTATVVVSPYLSVVVPLHNECQSLPELCARLSTVLRAMGHPYEIVLVDDGSTDGTPAQLQHMARQDAAVRVVTLARNYGQTAALAAGFDHARGRVIVAMDGDLQNTPEDLPRLVAKIEEGYDIVSGWRETRHEGYWTRRLPSRIANGLMARLSGVTLHDFGATFKAYRRPIARRLALQGEMHRFIPALASWQGARIAEVRIADRPRAAGQSHYGLSRTWRVMSDLLTVRFLLRYATRPLHLFGPIAFGLLALGSLGGAFVLGELVVGGGDALLEHGSLMATSVTMVAAGANLLALGLVAELLSRVYFDGTRRRVYTQRRAPRPARFDWNTDLRRAAQP
jgi:hypothetical protein